MSKLGSNNETDSLEEFFSGKLKNESMQPSEQVWERIEGSLSRDRKRRRGFIWLFFSGLFFIGAGISTYVVLSNHMGTSLSNKTSELKNKTNAVIEEKKLSEETTDKKTAAAEKNTEANANTAITNTEKENTVSDNKTEVSSTTENTVKEEKTNTVRIQLGAFKKQIDKSIFDKTGLVIKQETNESGVTCYYAEVPENEKQEALQKVQQAGFTDAFVKRNNLLAAKNDEAKNVERTNQSIQNNSGVLVAKNNVAKKETKNAEPTSTNLNIVAVTKPVVSSVTKNENTSTKTKDTNADLPLANNAGVAKNENNKKENIKTTVDETKQTPSDEIATVNSYTVSETNKPIEETKTEEAAIKQNDIVAKTDSVIKAPDESPPPIAITDSAKTEDKKKDEPLAAKANKDSLPLPLTERWALLLTGGPNFFLKNTSNSLFNTGGEKQPTTYNTSLKVEYKLLKQLSVSLGINYSYFTAQQDATLFYFNKNQTTDFIFYSSYGPMPVSMSTMLQDFNPAPWITTLKASYSYTSKINTLQVPLEAKLYFVNGKRINLFTSLGASGMFVISEQTNLSIIKEHMTNNLSYNQVNTTKFNALLMFGLGGDVRLYKKLYFTVDGGFKYGAVNLSNTTGIKTNPTYFSVNGGLKVKF